MKIKSLKFKSVNSTNDIALDLIKKNKFKFDFRKSDLK